MKNEFLIGSKALQRVFYRNEQLRYQLVLPNVKLDCGSEVDLFCLRKSWYLEEVEVKCTISDFRADFKKTVCVNRLDEERDSNRPYQNYIEVNKHEALQEGRLLPNYFSFLIPDHLMGRVDVPEYCGLYYEYHSRGRDSIACFKKPKLLHRIKTPVETAYKHARALSYRYWAFALNQRG